MLLEAIGVRVNISNTWTEPQVFTSGTLAGTSNQLLDIGASVAIGSGVHWTGLRITGDNLDPTGVGTRIRGIAVNMSGVDMTNSPDLEGVRIVMPVGVMGLKIVEGIAGFRFHTGSDTLAEYTAANMVINVADLDASSDVHGLDVAIAGVLAGSAAALGVHAYVCPIHQHVGALLAPGANYACRETTGPVYTDNIDGQSIWVANGDGICVGNAGKFDEIELLFTTPATKDELFTFWYYDNTPQWVQFNPGDDTDGGRQDGLIRWSQDSLTNWSSQDPCGATGDTGYWIRITRNRVSAPGAVTLATAKLLDATLYEWDKDGNISAHTFNMAGDLNHDGTNVGFFGKAPVSQRLKANYNNWAAFGDVVDALVDLGLFDAA